MRTAGRIRVRRNPPIPPLAAIFDPRGVVVYFAADRWIRHIVRRHPLEMEGRYDDVVATIEALDFINIWPGRHQIELYFRDFAGAWLLVVIEKNGEVGNVITAYPRRPSPQERTIWTR